jgi:N4-gp56 family major capsid protein
MANQFVDTTDWALFVQTAFDRVAKYFLRDQPTWRQMVDTRPVAQAMPGSTVTMSLHNPLTLATSPLSEDVDPDAVLAAAPTQINVVLNEYGNATLQTLRLRELAFDKPDVELAKLVGFNMLDSIDQIIRTVADGSTNVLMKNAGVLKTSGAVFNSIAATDLYTRDAAVVSGKLLQRAKVLPKVGDKYVGIIHPDVAYDLQNEASATAWVSPHTYGGDTGAIYSGVVGDYMGNRYIQTTRITTANNTVPVKCYNSYLFGQEALVEAVAIEPHLVLGPQTDKLRRYFPLGWHALAGWALFRPTAMVVTKTSSSIQAL